MFSVQQFAEINAHQLLEKFGSSGVLSLDYNRSEHKFTCNNMENFTMFHLQLTAFEMFLPNPDSFDNQLFIVSG